LVRAYVHFDHILIVINYELHKY